MSEALVAVAALRVGSNPHANDTHCLRLFSGVFDEHCQSFDRQFSIAPGRYRTVRDGEQSLKSSSGGA